VGERIEPGSAALACRVIETDEFARWCRRCGCEAAPRDSVTRRLAHEPLGWRPTTLLITIRRYRGTGCGHVSRQDTSRAAEPGEARDATASRLIEDPHRFEVVRVIGGDEHCWRHTRRGDKYVTVIIDLTPIRDATGLGRLLDMVKADRSRCSRPGSASETRPGTSLIGRVRA